MGRAMSFFEGPKRVNISTKSATLAATLFLTTALSQVSLSQDFDEEPTWSYGVGAPVIDPSTVFELPGSGRSFTHGEIRDPFGPADWYPGDHPTMPDIVANGQYPDVWACALCHYPNGKGRPENAGIAGLPKEYFIQQLEAFRSGQRKSAQPRQCHTQLMTTIAQGMTDELIEQAADYYSSMPWTPWIRVVETEEVPTARFSLGMYIPLEGENAARDTDHGDAGERRACGGAARPLLGFYRLCPGGLGCKRRGAGDDGWRRKDSTVLHLPRPRPERAWLSPWYRGPLAHLCGTTNVRHAGRHKAWGLHSSHATGRRQPHDGGHDQHRCICSLAATRRAGIKDGLNLRAAPPALVAARFLRNFSPTAAPSIRRRFAHSG